MGEPALVIPFPEPGTFEDAWKALPATMKARSDKKATCDALWRREAKRLGGERMLLLRLKTYLRDSPDLKRTGGPGLQVLLRSGKLEHWTPMHDAPLAPDVTRFPVTEIRQALVRIEGEGWVKSYLDPCVIDGTTLIVRTGMAVDKLKAHGALFKAHGFTGLKKRETRQA
ncbi:MAG: hypothetical protein JSS57_17400 [Proteobacteria bacterium]|nr:hypothetical protein [Pseudomonadota bacterium]